MNLAICSIQRNRAQWLPEWISFHYVVGFRKFYIFLHSCTDDSERVIKGLSKYFDISVFIVSNDVDRPQLAAYKYCYKNYGDSHDWIAFIDGDEFLFSPNSINISNHLSLFSNKLDVGALGIYWVCFGSSGHMHEPKGLMTDSYRWRAELNFQDNKHFKSIVKGGDSPYFNVTQNSHFFVTSKKTYDTRMRNLVYGKSDFEPCYERLQINHYVTQSREFYENFKMKSGAADGNSYLVRSEEWWQKYDVNDVYDNSLAHLRDELVATVNACINFI